MIQDFLAALTLLTTFSIPGQGLHSPRLLGKSFAWFPLVGLILGIALTMMLYVFRAIFSELIAAGLVIALWAFLTGALHLEALADSGDGLAATVSPEKRLEIMHDPRVGAFGVVTLAIALIVKFAAVASLRAEYFLVLAPTLARWAMVLAAAFPLARNQGMAAMFQNGFGRRELLIATAIAALIAAIFGWRGLGAFVATSLVVYLFARLASTRLGGLNGDIYGAIGEIAEVTVLLLGTVSLGR